MDIRKNFLKVFLVVLTAFSIFTLWGCKESPRTPTPTAKTHYEFQGVHMNMDFQEALALLGEYESSTKEDANLTSYIFPHFIVMTYQNESTERINMIALRSSAVTTEEGVTVGDTKENVIEKQGDEYADGQDGSMIYVKGNSVLTFLIDEDGYVISIQYSTISEE